MFIVVNFLESIRVIPEFECNKCGRDILIDSPFVKVAFMVYCQVEPIVAKEVNTSYYCNLDCLKEDL